MYNRTFFPDTAHIDTNHVRHSAGCAPTDRDSPVDDTKRALLMRVFVYCSRVKP